MYSYPFQIRKLINEISKLPGVGPKMAERITLYLIKNYAKIADDLKNAIEGIKDIKICRICFNISEDDICSICKDTTRDKKIICIIESPEDIITIEKTEKFNGLYHILYGLINPINGIMPENLKIKELLERLKKDEKVIEIILALNHTVEGDATSLYLYKEIKSICSNIKITRLAKGLPTGSDIRYADEITLGQAIQERKEI